MTGGLPLSQSEFARPRDMGVDLGEVAALATVRVEALIASGRAAPARLRIAELIQHGDYGRPALGDETLELVRDQFRRFAAAAVEPHAHGWHLRDELIPIEVVAEMAELGVFGLTVPEEFRGLGLGKLAMCLV